MLLFTHKKFGEYIRTVTEITVTDHNGKYIKVCGGTITVDNPGGNNKDQQVDLARIF